MIGTQLEQSILRLRPDLTRATLRNWATGMAGCTMQTETDAMKDLLVYAQRGKPMPWEQTINTQKHRKPMEREEISNV